jgi:hypothetical protein
LLFFDFLESGAWPFLVGVLICLFYTVTERDINILNSNFSKGKKKKKKKKHY